MNQTITITITNGVSIISPARRVSDRVGLELADLALTVTIPAVTAEAKLNGAAVLGAVATADNNHSWVQPDQTGNLDGNRWGEGNYIPGGYANHGVKAILSDGKGRGPGGVAQTVRLQLTAAAADAIAFVASTTNLLNLWVDGTTITITAEVQ